MADGDIRSRVEGSEPEPDRTDLDLAKRPRNDMGNAERLVARVGGDLIHVDEQGWCNWTGTHWAPPLSKKAPEAVRLAKLVVKKIVDEAKALKGDAKDYLEAIGGVEPAEGTPQFEELKLKKSMIGVHHKFALTSGMNGKISAMLALAEPDLRKQPEELDVDAWRFNCASGTLQLLPPGAALPKEPVYDGSGVDVSLIASLLEHERTHYITKLGNVAFDAAAKCPEFEKFLAEIQPDHEMRAFLQRVFGYCLCADVSEQKIFMFWGEGSNGKSTLIDIIRAVLGTYAVKVPIEAFLRDDHRKAGQATPELMGLRGAHAAFASEPPEGAQLAEDKVKQVTGDGNIQARGLFQGMVEFPATFKMIISFNPKPKIRGKDKGIWRRIVLVPFGVTIDEPDETLAERIKQNELAGVLNWMLEGFYWWRVQGLAPPAAVVAATEEYRQESDAIGEFLAMYTERREGVRIQAKRLYEVYARACRENARDVLSSTAFGNYVSKRFKKEKVGVVFYQGLELNEDGLAIEAKGHAKAAEGSGGSDGEQPSKGDPRDKTGYGEHDD